MEIIISITQGLLLIGASLNTVKREYDKALLEVIMTILLNFYM